MSYWGNWGIVFPLVILIIGCIASFVVERIKKRNNVQTYSEILSFIEGVPRDEERITRERQHLVATRLLMAVISAIIAATVTVIGFLIFL
jgi:hypothetical protein